MLKLPHNCTHLTHYQSNTKILQVRVQQYVNCELPHVQAGFIKGRGMRDQIANIRWIIKKARELQKNIYFCFTDYAKAFDCVDHSKLQEILKETGIPDHLTCLLRNLYAGQEATVKTGHGTTNWFQIGKGVLQGCILSTCLFNLCAEYIGASLVTQRLKCLPGMQETQVRSLGQEDPLEKEIATHSSTLAWKIPWTEEPGRLQSMGLQRVKHD